jgi:hypothetical protein
MSLLAASASQAHEQTNHFGQGGAVLAAGPIVDDSVCA